ncbi:MAG: hypothetical protein ACT4PE_18320 [Candidatus Eiseniibacteriota bacterium]
MVDSLLRRLPIVLLLCLSAGCGGGWRGVALDSLDAQAQSLGGEEARFILKDERVIEMRVLHVQYPFVEGHRLVGAWSTERKMRVDLREVARLEVRKASG